MFNFTENQAAAINTLNCNVSVSAGAGSGKTRVLVERFINILAQGIKNPQNAVVPKEILAITFTRKAAAEMKERIRKRLYELEKEDALNRDFWHKQRQGFDQARISTIHGFCNGILKENPVETELDPAFNVAEENDMTEFLQTGIFNYIKKALAERSVAVETLVRAYGIDGFKNQLYTIYAHADEVLAFGDLAAPYAVDENAVRDKQAELVQLVDELIAGTDNFKKNSPHWNELKKLEENHALIIEAVKDFADAEKQAILDEHLQSISKRGKDKATVAAAQDALNALYQSITDKRAQELVICWQQVLQGCTDYIKTLQMEQNLIGFDDLESMALNLLANSPEIRHKYQQNFKYIMVDEFQDTNERQREIVYLLCGDDKNKLCGNKLFIVGDPKQSIYRFRGADVNVFARVRRDIEAGGGKNITMDDNFRTVDKILDLCNETFPDLLGLDETKDVFFEALQANRESQLLPEMLVISYDAETAPYSERQTEANAIAQKIKMLHDEDGVPYGDIVILLRAMTHVGTYEATLNAAGISCTVVDGKGFYGRQEIVDFINLLTVCADSRRDLELAGVLRSPYFALDDETITALFFKMQDDKTCESLWQQLQSGAYPDYLSKAKKAQLANCAQTLSNIYNAAAAMPLTDLLIYIEETLNLNALLAAQPGGAEQLANVKKLFSLAGDFCLHRQGGLREYLDNIKKLRAMAAREASSPADNERETVTIMTIHKSKGLEFPTVILPVLDGKIQSDKTQIRFNKNIGLGIKADVNGSLLASSVYNKISELNKELDDAEKQRQFYVAVTRARDRLIMSGIVKTNKNGKEPNNWFTRLRSILLGYTGLNFNTLDAAEIPAPEEITALTEVVELTNEIKANIKPLPAYGKAWQQNFSASALQQYDICPRSYYYHYILQMPQVEPVLEGEGSMDARTLGTLIHAALEKYNGDAHKALMQAAYENDIAANPAGAENLLNAYLQSDLYPGLNIKQLHETEFNLPLLADYGINANCHGFIDNIIFNEDNTLTIIDYKTGHVPDGLPKGYLYQLGLYKLAAQQLFKIPVKTAELHFLRGCKKLALPDDFDPQQIAADLQQLFAKQDEADFECRTTYCHNCPYSYFCKKCE